MSITLVETSATKFFRFGLNISTGSLANSILPKTVPCSREKIGVCPNVVHLTVFNCSQELHYCVYLVSDYLCQHPSVYPKQCRNLYEEKKQWTPFLIAFIVYLFCIFRLKRIWQKVVLIAKGNFQMTTVFSVSYYL